MSRTTINRLLRAYAESIGYGYDSEIIPRSLSGGTQYPYILWVAPTSDTDGAKRIFKYPSTIYIVGDAGERNVSELLDELQVCALGIYEALQSNKTYTDRSFRCEPMTDFDNSTAHGLKVTINIYYDGGC